jgi:hypothetical protein
MPSSYTNSLRLELQFTGENVNVWGDRLNTVITRAEQAMAGVRTIALTGDYALTASNTTDDDARYAVLKFTGGTGPFTVTIPSVSKIYKIWNASGATLTITTGAGATVQIAPADIVEVFCDGTGVKTLGYGGNSLKDYIASVVVGGGASLPSLVGNSGKWLTNNGSVAQWALPTTNEISNYASDQAAREAALTASNRAFAVAMATVL